jgi:primosomal protein N' (replication factor Y)
MHGLDAETLFAPDDPPVGVEEPSRASGPFAAVALEQGIDRLLDYAIPPRLVPLLKAGQRVRVPLGRRNRPTPGYVLSIRPTSD